MRHLSNGKEHHFTADAMGSVTVPVERGKPMSLFVYPPAPWLWGSFYPEPIAQDKDFTLVTKMVDSVSLDVRLALSTSDAPDFNEFAFDINNNNCCEHFWNDQVLLTPPDYRAIINEIGRAHV